MCDMPWDCVAKGKELKKLYQQLYSRNWYKVPENIEKKKKYSHERYLRIKKLKGDVDEKLY